MQIEIFTLCDSAQVYAGKGVIMGALNQISVKSLPVQIPMITLAVRISYEDTEVSDKTYKIEIINPDGTPFIPTIECGSQAQPPQSMFWTVDFNLSFNNIQFTQAGKYTIRLHTDGQVFETRFAVIQVG